MSAKRADRLKGITHKFDMCGSLFITLNEDDKGKPYELFCFGSKLGTCRSNLEALARCVSKMLQLGELEEAIDACEKIRCPAMERKKGVNTVTKEKEIDKMPWSCPDAVSRLLAEYKK